MVREADPISLAQNLGSMARALFDTQAATRRCSVAPPGRLLVDGDCTPATPFFLVGELAIGGRCFAGVAVLLGSGALGCGAGAGA